MRRPVQISIPSPCHENWAAMTPAEKGRFCGSCQKVVHDFTRSSDREIESVLSQEKNTCGRFTNTQLNRDLIINKEKKTAWVAASVAIVSMLSVSYDSVAQTPQITQQEPSNNGDEVIGKVAAHMISNVIAGTVTDSTNAPLPGVNIIVRGTVVSTQTDHEGRYTIEASQGNVIEYSFVGMKTRVMMVRQNANINVRLEDDIDSITTGVIVTVTTAKDRTFFGRIFNSIGNLFR